MNVIVIVKLIFGALDSALEPRPWHFTQDKSKIRDLNSNIYFDSVLKDVPQNIEARPDIVILIGADQNRQQISNFYILQVRILHLDVKVENGQVQISTSSNLILNDSN